MAGSSLSRAVRKPATQLADIRAWAATAWRRMGVLVLWLDDDVADPVIRQALINEGNRRYGTRDQDLGKRRMR